MNILATLIQFSIKGRKATHNATTIPLPQRETFLKSCVCRALAQYIIVHLVECYATFENNQINLRI